ncbi:MAG: hypothetical protein KGQ79_00490 [Proteobacteria bacterium]|nr:hypothetical protein [Pseudomonadota bacterium]MBU6425515.1 hypothetical protein [Rhodospirillales bacterium]
MRASAFVVLIGLILLAGCSTPQPVTQSAAATAQPVAYTARVLAVRPVSGGLALAQVLQTLGEPDAGQNAAAREIVIQMPDGSVKSLVPPPGTALGALTPGTNVLVSETPQLRIVAR